MYVLGPWRRRSILVILALAVTLAVALGVTMAAGLVTGLPPGRPGPDQVQQTLAPDGSASGDRTAGPAQGHSVFLAYFANPRDNTLEPQAVLAPEPLPPARGVALALKSLCQGPTPEMQRLGITSAVPAGCRVHGVTAANDRLLLDASPEFYAVSPSQAGLWRDQIEMTAAQVPGIRQVIFRIDGRPLAAAGLQRLGLSGPLAVDGRPGQLRLRRGPESSMARAASPARAAIHA